MSGTGRYLVDTNVLVSLLEGNRKASATLEGKTLFISFITEIELLGVPGITEAQQSVIADVLKEIAIIGFSETIGRRTIAIKQRKKVRVPDAIIAATSMELDIPLLTADKDFRNIENIACILLES